MATAEGHSCRCGRRRALSTGRSPAAARSHSSARTSRPARSHLSRASASSPALFDGFGRGRGAAWLSCSSTPPSRSSCGRSSAALCELAGPSGRGLGARSRFGARVMTIARSPRQRKGRVRAGRLALELTARSRPASRNSHAAGGCIGSIRSAREPRRAKPGDISRAWSLGGMSDRLSDRETDPTRSDIGSLGS